MSRSISDIVMDSVDYLTQVNLENIQPQNGDVERNIEFIKNILSNEKLVVTEEVKLSCRNILEKF